MIVEQACKLQFLLQTGNSIAVFGRGKGAVVPHKKKPPAAADVRFSNIATAVFSLADTDQFDISWIVVTTTAAEIEHTCPRSPHRDIG
jgi:hypothetical protein